MEAFIKSIQLGRKVERFRAPQLKVVINTSSLLFLYYAFKAEVEKRTNESELILKKDRLKMPVYEVTEEDLINPPWSGKNYEDWKYRLVKVNGRQVHRKTMFIPRDLHNYDGYDYIVPVVTKENATFDEQIGVLVNKGFMPHEYKDLGNRWRLENASQTYDFVGMVTRGEDLDKSAFFKKGNAWDEQRFIFNNFFLPDMARATGFKNKSGVEQAVIEVLDLNETELDEKNPNHYNKNMSGTTTFPFPKTLAGALQPPVSNNDLLKRQVGYVALAALAILY
jgi:surfeit locus 1 family protein